MCIFNAAAIFKAPYRRSKMMGSCDLINANMSASVSGTPIALGDMFAKNRLMWKVEIGCFSKLWTSKMCRTLQSSTVYVSRVSYLFECNANDTYVLRMTQIG